MNEYIRIFFKIKIHSLTLVLFILSVLSARFIELILLFTIIFIHELGHAFMATKFRWRIKQLHILPFGGELETEEHSNKPAIEELLVILAGPAQHIFLFLLFNTLHHIQWISSSTYEQLLIFNSIIMLTNLLPVWPLDGGKLVFLLLSMRFPYMRAHRLMLDVSIFVTLLILFVVLLFAPMHLNSWLFIGFIVFSMWKEYKQRRYIFLRHLLNRKPDKKKISSIKVDADEQLMRVMERFYRNREHEVIIIKNQRVIGRLHEKDIIKHYFDNKSPFATIESFIR